MGDEAKIIDLERWPRREHYAFFKEYPIPFFSITTSLDVAPLRNALKTRDVPFTAGILYVLARSANAVPEFRQRIRKSGPIEHAHVHPGVTVLCEGDVFRFCFIPYSESFDDFVHEAVSAMAAVRESPSLVHSSLVKEGRIRDDMLFCTSLPWFSFSGMLHPVSPDPIDSVPRIAWGRFEQNGGRLAMPLNVQAHHALLDGVHLAKFFKHAQELIQNAEAIIEHRTG